MLYNNYTWRVILTNSYIVFPWIIAQKIDWKEGHIMDGGNFIDNAYYISMAIGQKIKRTNNAH